MNIEEEFLTEVETKIKSRPSPRKKGINSKIIAAIVGP